DRIARIPGVRSEGVVSVLPLHLAGPVSWGAAHFERSALGSTEVQADYRLVSPDYFRTMGIPLLRGRIFTDHDSFQSAWVAIVDTNLARRLWHSASPLGRHLWFDPDHPITIVGVVGAVKQYGLDTAERPSVYLSYRIHPEGGGFLVVRTASDPAALAGTITRAIQTLDADVLVYDVRTMQGRLDDALARHRFSPAT